MVFRAVAQAQEGFCTTHRAKSLELRFLLRLSGIVRGPILCVRLARDLDRLGCDGLTVCGLLALDRVFNCKDVFAFRIAKLEVSASAFRLSFFMATVYFSSRPACEGTTLRTTFDLAAISKPLISLGSIV